MFGFGLSELSVYYTALGSLDLQEPAAGRKESIRGNYAGSIGIDNYLKDLFLAREMCKPKKERDLGNLPIAEELRGTRGAL